MMAKTHVIVGLTYGVALLPAVGTRYTPVEYGAVVVGLVIGSLLPDIDHPHSTISQFIPIVGRFISAWTQHRGLFHSILGVVLMFGAAGLASSTVRSVTTTLGLPTELPPYIGAGLIIGYALHIIADMLTTHGVKLFYPLRWNVGLPLFSTGGFREVILRWGLIIFCGLMVARFILGYIA
jgi:inner membrane protein